MAKKKYNPFKMFGSYVGLLLPLIITLISSNITLTDLFTRCDHGYEDWCSLGKAVIFISMIIGFLLGWGIHSLVRKLKK